MLGLSCKLRRMAVVFLDPFCYEYSTELMMIDQLKFQIEILDV